MKWGRKLTNFLPIWRILVTRSPCYFANLYGLLDLSKSNFEAGLNLLISSTSCMSLLLIADVLYTIHNPISQVLTARCCTRYFRAWNLTLSFHRNSLNSKVFYANQASEVFQQTNDSYQQIALFIVDWTFQTTIHTCFNIFGILRHDQSYNWQTSELTRLANQTETFKVKFDTHTHLSSKVVLLYRFACIIQRVLL